MNEKLMELFKNKKFMLIFSGFIALIGLIIIIRRKAPESQTPDNNSENEEKKRIREQKKTIKELERKNKELEEKANGKSITGANSQGKPKPTKSDDTDTRKTGASAGDDEIDDTDEPADK